MSTSRVLASKSGGGKPPGGRSKAEPRALKVLAERNQAVAAVGVWVEEGGQDLQEHPCTLASLTEEIQAERRRESEESLRRFQDEVRHRVARQAQECRRTTKPHSRVPQKQISAEAAAQWGWMEKNSTEPAEGLRQVRLRLAACGMTPRGEMASDLPGGRWNFCPRRHRTESRMLRAEQDVEEEEEDEEEKEEEEKEGFGVFSRGQHECPLVQQKRSGHVLWDSAGLKSSLSVPQVHWAPADQEELRRQRQSQFLIHRRLCMSSERKQVKENKQNRKHLKRTARIKTEKEQLRLEEERKLERARQQLEEREMLVLERLRLEEEEEKKKKKKKEEERAQEELQRRKKKEKAKVTSRAVEAVRAGLRQRLAQQEEQQEEELPPLCCCASSFWDSHPDTCANNCIFHNNPKAYTKALHSALLSLDLR